MTGNPTVRTETLLAPSSRYYRVGIHHLLTAAGREIPYLNRRFPPRSETMACPQSAIIKESERLDLVAARALGNPLLYWRICDANDAMHPAALTAKNQIGKKLRIPGLVLEPSTP